MRTVVLGPRPAELEALIERRRALGVDLYDEMWEGVYHVVPAAGAAHGYLDNVLAVLLDPLARRAGLVGTGPFNLGEPANYRVPDRGYHRGMPHGTWLPTAAMVVEIVSPDDETYEKFGFYTQHTVDEILVADPTTRQITIWSLGADAYDVADRSALFDVATGDLTAAIGWPDAD